MAEWQPQNPQKNEPSAQPSKIDDGKARQWQLKVEESGQETGQQSGQEKGRDAGDKSNFDSSTGASDPSATGTNFGGAFQREVELEPGTVIGGAYRIIKLIGRGGMGQVYMAEHLALAKKCALKVMPSNLVTEKAWKRFQTEAKAISGLEHRNLVRVTDLGIHQNSLPFYAMEYVDGQSLAQLLQAKGKLDQATTLEILRQICDGIECAHQQGIVHRDLKPANIMLAQEGNVANAGQPLVKILDFGLAKLSQKEAVDVALTVTGEIFGSPIYMSPEQCLGEPTDLRTDIYSLGCTIFECLTGQPPFAGDKALAIMNNKIINQAPSMASMCKEKSFAPDLEYVVARMLKKTAGDRYQTIAQLEADLTAFMSGHALAVREKPARARPATLAEQIRDNALASRSQTQSKQLKTTRLVLAVLIGLGLVFAAILGLERPAPISLPNQVKAGNVPSVPDFIGPAGWLDRARSAYKEMFGTANHDPVTHQLSTQRQLELGDIVREAQQHLMAYGPAAIPICVQDITAGTMSAPISRAVLVNNGQVSVDPILKEVMAKPVMLRAFCEILQDLGPKVGNELCDIAATANIETERKTAIKTLAHLALMDHSSRHTYPGHLAVMTEKVRTILLGLLKGEREPEIRQDLIQALGYFKTPTPQSLKTLSDVIKTDPSERVVEEAIRTLGYMLEGASEYGGVSTETLLCDELSTPGRTPEAKIAILGALSKRKGSLTADHLSKIKAAANDSSESVQAAAKIVLTALTNGNPPAAEN